MSTFIMYAFLLVIGGLAGGIITFRITLKKREAEKRNIERLNRTLNMLNQWLILKEKGIELKFPIENSINKKVIIYGFSIKGRHLARELIRSGVEVTAAIDRKKMSPFENIHVYQINHCNIEADIIINTVITEHQSVSNNLKKYFDCPIVSLEDIIFESY